MSRLMLMKLVILPTSFKISISTVSRHEAAVAANVLVTLECSQRQQTINLLAKCIKPAN